VKKMLVLQIFLVALLMLGAASAYAASYTVDAYANSTGGGVGVSTITLMAGQSFTVTVGPNDLWNAGPLPRWSNADGLTKDLYATGSDDSGQPAGAQIGAPFPNYSQGGLTAPYGSLVGDIGGSGNFFFVGTNYTGIAPAAGALNLYYFDSNNGDNTQYITANITANVNVPEPGAILLLVPGLVGLVGFRKRFSA
jgi:hypothetical protein